MKINAMATIDELNLQNHRWAELSSEKILNHFSTLCCRTFRMKANILPTGQGLTQNYDVKGCSWHSFTFFDINPLPGL